MYTCLFVKPTEVEVDLDVCVYLDRLSGPSFSGFVGYVCIICKGVVSVYIKYNCVYYCDTCYI
jgi:hypothetical protein